MQGCLHTLQVRTRTNRSGGVQGGISNGEDVVIRVAFKPTSTIGVKQRTVRAGRALKGGPRCIDTKEGGQVMAGRTRLIGLLALHS